MNNDKNGNLLRLQRKGAVVDTPIYNTPFHFGTMDNLSYIYDGISNRLQIVSDKNGNFGFKIKLKLTMISFALVTGSARLKLPLRLCAERKFCLPLIPFI